MMKKSFNEVMSHPLDRHNYLIRFLGLVLLNSSIFILYFIECCEM